MMVYVFCWKVSSLKSEIGGYFELDHYLGPSLHQKEIALNCGRSCIEYLIKLRGIRCIWLPDYLCSSVSDVCQKCGIDIQLYEIDRNFLPQYSFRMGTADWLYLVDYFGQLKTEDIEFAREFAAGNLILDESQAYYREPLDIDTLYTCRKWFGVADGAFLHTSDGQRLIDADIPKGSSAAHMGYVLGRYEATAAEFFELSKINNARFIAEGLTSMSALTANLLKGIDYEAFAYRRIDNYRYVDRALGGVNRLAPRCDQVPFMYPLLLNYDASTVRKRLASKGVYIPLLWPNVLKDDRSGSQALEYAACMLLLPIDQRYDLNDMDHLTSLVGKVLKDE